MPPDLTSVRLVDLDPDRSEVERLAAFLEREETRRAASYRHAADTRRYVVRRGRLREMLADELGCRPDEIVLSVNGYGKPALAHGGPKFNLSHSGDFALIVISPEREVGCDLERRRPELATPQVAAAHFSNAEQAELAEVPEDLWTEAFFNCWTRKEAVIKGLGLGVSYPLKSFDVSLSPEKPAALLGGLSGWSLGSFRPLPGLEAAIALES